MPVVLAPMAGVTNSAFRTLCRSYGAGLYVSEMVTARALVEGNAKTLGMASFGADETVRSVQLSSVDPTVMGRAVRRLVGEIGVDHIDLNFGCPAGKVTRQGAGAALPVHRALFRDIVAGRGHQRRHGAGHRQAPHRASTTPTSPTSTPAGSPRTRGWPPSPCTPAPPSSSTRARPTGTPSDGSRQAVTSIPVLGNGDLWEAADALAMMAATGCDGVVVGRGCLGRPWLFRDLAAAFRGRARARPRPAWARSAR